MTVQLTIIERAGAIDLNLEDSFYEQKRLAGWAQGKRIRFGQYDLGIKDEWFFVECMHPAIGEREAYIRICQPSQ